MENLKRDTGTDRTGNRAFCLTGISKEESHAGKMEKTVVFQRTG